ncbi:MAG: H-X9-DG-CTERM domain-containing protein [Solirubrobacterales bacterium]
MVPVRWGRLAGVVLFVISVTQGPAAFGASAVEELTKRMPDDVVAFIGTSGSDVLKGDFEKTLIGRIWNDPGVRTFYQSIKFEVLAKAQQETGDAAFPKKVDDVLGTIRLALSRPVVIGAAQVPVEEGPPVAGFVILDAGDRKAELETAVSRLEAIIGRDNIVGQTIDSFVLRASGVLNPMPLYWGWIDNHFVVVVNDAKGVAVKYLSRPRSKPHTSLGKAPDNGDALVVAADLQKARQLIGSTILSDSGKEDADAFASVLKGLGLADAKGFIARAGFAGPDLTVQAVLETPASAAGLFSLYKPLDPGCLAVVDARAVTAGAANCDFAALYDAILGVVKSISPEDDYPAAQKAISRFESEAKLRIREGLLASLAGPMVFYSLPSGAVMEMPRGGAAVIAKLKDAPLFEKTMVALGTLAASKAKGAFQPSEEKRDAGRVVHVWVIPPLAMMGMTPTWSIVKDQAVIGFSTEMHDLAVQRLVSSDASTKSLLAVEGYRKTAAELPKNLTRLTYIDSQVRFSQSMMQLRQAWPMITMMTTRTGLRLPAAMPPLTQVTREMKPSLRYSYWASDGLHMTYRGPGIEVGQMDVNKTALGMGILMPALARVRQLSFRMTSGTNLVGIGKACQSYAAHHDGKLPPDLKTLVTEADLPAKFLESKLKPKDFAGPSYIYISGQSASMDRQNVVAYDNPEFCTEGVNVLFLDGHVEFMRPKEFRLTLEATCKRLNRPMPDIRFGGEAQVEPGAAKPLSPGTI